MKTSKTISRFLAIATVAATVASGAPVRTDINPAMHYQAFTVAPDLSEADRAYLFNREWRGQKLPERFGELVRRYDNQSRLVRQAAHATVPCDWGLDLSPGPNTLLSHLARCKAIAQAARLRVMWDPAGPPQRGARRLAGGLRARTECLS